MAIMTQDNDFVLIASNLFLWTSTILELFQLPGKISHFKELRNIIGNGVTIVESQVFLSCVLI